nr:PREDICTED: tachykinin-like peptides receptor 99D isoform X3 [Linepithema humile]
MQNFNDSTLFNTTSYPWNVTTYDYDGYHNGSNYTDLEPRNQFVLPWWRQMIWTFLFACMIAVATGGNLIVIWIVLAHRRMRTVTNYFLVNLSIADAMVSTLNVIFNYTYMLNSHWPFGTLYCKISQFIAVLTICASVFTLMAISIDRYMAIVNPLRPRMGKKATLCVAIVIWIVGVILSLPMLVFYTTYTQNFINGEVRVICYGAWPNTYDEYLYNVVFTILTYFLPIGSMTFTYARVGLELWGSQSIGEATARQLENIRSKRRSGYGEGNKNGNVIIEHKNGYHIMDVHITNSQRSGRCACNTTDYVFSVTTAEIVSTVRLQCDIHLAEEETRFAFN